MLRHIKFRLLLLILLFFKFTSISLSDVNKIDKIDVLGTQRVDIETVISYSDVNLGDIYNEELGNKILKDLFDTNLFSNIEIAFEDNKLQINVRENPTINLVKFSGNSKIKDDPELLAFVDASVERCNKLDPTFSKVKNKTQKKKQNPKVPDLKKQSRKNKTGQSGHNH